MPSHEERNLMIASAAYGWLEGKAKGDDSFMLNRLPKPIDALGYTGNVAVILWAAAHFTRNKWLRIGSRAVANIAAYQLGRRGSLFTSGKDFFTISGYSDDDVAAALQAAQVGALDPAAADMDMAALQYDPSVVDYGG